MTQYETNNEENEHHESSARYRLNPELLWSKSSGGDDQRAAFSRTLGARAKTLALNLPQLEEDSSPFAPTIPVSKLAKEATKKLVETSHGRLLDNLSLSLGLFL